MLVWLTQLGLSTVLPLAGFLLLGIWLHTQLGWGKWSLICGILLGVLSGVRGFWDALKAMELMAKDPKDSTASQDHP